MRKAPRTTFVLLLGAAACAPAQRMEVRAPVGECAAAARPAVAWARPTADGEQAKLDAWCDAAGSPVVREAAFPVAAADAAPGRGGAAGALEVTRGGPAATGAAVVEPAASLTVATWNVHVGSGELLRFLEERLGHRCEAGASATSASTAGAEPFVLLVQEAHRVSDALPPIPDGVALPSRIEKPPASGTRIDIVETARRCGLSLFYAPSMRNGAEDAGEVPEDRGNAILASVPLSDFTAIELPLETQRRVAVTALAHPPGRAPVRVASFHLDVAASLMRVLTTGNATRYLQGMGLVRGIEALEARDAVVPVATVIGGDVNTWSEKETVIRHLVERFPESPAPTDEGTRGPFPTDHLFVRAAPGSGVSVADGSYRVIPEDYSSDHRPRLLTLRFGDATEVARSK